MKKMKTMVRVFVFSVIVLLISSNISYADNHDFKSLWKFNFMVGLRSEFLGRPGLQVHNRPLVEGLVVATYNDKFYIAGWGSTSWNSKGISHKNNFSREIDLIAGLYQQLGFAKMEFRVSYFALNFLSKSNDDVLALDWAADFTIPHFPVTPYLEIQYSGEVGRKSPERGWFGWPGLKNDFSISKSVTLNIRAYAEFSDGALGKDPGFIYSRLQLTPTIKVGSKLSVSPTVIFQFPASNQDGKPGDYANRERVVFGLSFNF